MYAKLKKVTTLAASLALAGGAMAVGAAPASASMKPKLMYVSGSTMSQCKVVLGVTKAGLAGSKQYPWVDQPCQKTALSRPVEYGAIIGYYPKK
jgi:hypothetical protein